MEELFLKTEQGNIPIEKNIAEKYKLKKGMKTPFTNNILADRNGDSILEKKVEKNTLPPPEKNSQIFTTAETIDIAQGADS